MDKISGPITQCYQSKDNWQYFTEVVRPRFCIYLLHLKTCKFNLQIRFWCHMVIILKPADASLRNMQTSLRNMQSVKSHNYLATFFSLIITDNWSWLWFTLRFGPLSSLLVTENRPTLQNHTNERLASSTPTKNRKGWFGKWKWFQTKEASLTPNTFTLIDHQQV